MFIKLFSNLILILIRIIEKIEYRNIQLDENDINKKVLINNNLNIEVLSDNGFVSTSNIIKTQPYTIYELETNNGLKLQCADNHIIFDNSFNEIFIKNIKIGTKIQTKYGLDEVKSIVKTKHKISMFDLSIDDINHRYFTNDILSHNTTMSSLYLLWFSIFNKSKNVLVMANKGETMTEIIDKIKNVYENLPYFLKCGINSWGATYIRFENKCRVFGQATTKSPGLGFTIHLLYCDEFAHIPPNIIGPFFENVYPTLSSSKISRFIITSTANDTNLFYDIWTKAVKGMSEFHPIRVDWWEVEGRDEEWKRREIANSSIMAFNRQYGNQFISESSLLFDEQDQRFANKISTKFVNKDVSEFMNNLDEDFLKHFYWHPDFNPDRLKRNYYVISIDFADGLGLDYSVINIFELQTVSQSKIKKFKDGSKLKDFVRLVQVGYYYDNYTAINDFTTVFTSLLFGCFNINNIKVIFEVNDNRYLAIYTTLMKHKLFSEECLYMSKHSENAKSKKPGLKLNKVSRQGNFSIFKNLFRKTNFVIQDELFLEELMSFSQSPNGTYQSYLKHDDAAMSVVNTAIFYQDDDFDYLIEDFYEYYVDDLTEQLISNTMNRSEYSYEEYSIIDILNSMDT